MSATSDMVCDGFEGEAGWWVSLWEGTVGRPEVWQSIRITGALLKKFKIAGVLALDEPLFPA